MRHILKSNPEKAKYVHELYCTIPCLGKHHVSPGQLQKYMGSFVGKDFKCVVQVAPMLYGSVFPEYRSLWISLSLLTKILYCKYDEYSMDYVVFYLKWAIDKFTSEI
jgi:hypothetical protein